jgi:glycerol uptake facilitator protein
MADVRFSWKLAAEFIGTAALVFCGPGTAAATGVIAKSSGVAFSMAQLGVVALAFMMVIVAMIYTVGHISGCHINPAVTIALAAARKAPWSDVPGYLAAQFLGATAGAFAVWSILEQPGLDAGLGVLSYAPGHARSAFCAELIGTFLLVLVVFGTTTDSRATPGWYGLAIPAIVFAVITVVGPVTGAALNPARYLGPMVASGALGGAGQRWEQVPVYLVATVLGGLLAAACYAFLGAVPAAAAHQPASAPPETGQPRARRGPGPRPRGPAAPVTPGPARRGAGATTVDATTLESWIRQAAKLIEDNTHYLTHLDAVIGDADHGTNMRRGFKSAVISLDEATPATPGAVLDIAGQAFTSNLGGAAGPLYGAGFGKAAPFRRRAWGSRCGPRWPASRSWAPPRWATRPWWTCGARRSPRTRTSSTPAGTWPRPRRRRRRRPSAGCTPRSACRPARVGRATSASGPSATRTRGRPPACSSCARWPRASPVPPVS